MTHLPPLEQRPRGPRRVVQKLWADKDQRDAIIQQLEALVGSGTAAWSGTIRIDARESGTMQLTVTATAEGRHR